MASYWEEHSKTASTEEMMLDTNAEKLDEVEFPEIMGILPDFTGKDVLELGAGIGLVYNIPCKIYIAYCHL